MNDGKAVRVLMTICASLAVILAINLVEKKSLVDTVRKVEEIRARVEALRVSVGEMQSKMRTAERMQYLEWMSLRLELLPGKEGKMEGFYYDIFEDKIVDAGSKSAIGPMTFRMCQEVQVRYGRIREAYAKIGYNGFSRASLAELADAIINVISMLPEEK